jgi:hypothetical protein
MCRALRVGIQRAWNWILPYLWLAERVSASVDALADSAKDFSFAC